jgi:hypothetical protein
MSFFLFPTLIPLSGVDTTCFSLSDKFFFTKGRLSDVNPPWELQLYDYNVSKFIYSSSSSAYHSPLLDMGLSNASSSRQFISSSSSSLSAHHSPLLDIGLSKFSPSRSILGHSHRAPASRPAQVVTPPGLRASYTTFT